MIETRQIRYFVALAEHLHFGKAALALNVAQPALSQQIRQLEDELGSPLFERNTRRVTLLPAGNNFLARAQAILHELSLAAEEAKDINVGHSGSVRIGFVSTAAPRLIPELLHRLRRKYPRIQVDLYETDPHDQVQQLHWLRIDIGIMLFHPNVPKCPHRRSDDGGRGCACVAGLPRRVGRIFVKKHAAFRAASIRVTSGR